MTYCIDQGRETHTHSPFTNTMQTETTQRFNFDCRSNVRLSGTAIYASEKGNTIELAGLDEQDLVVAVASYVECLSYRDNAAKNVEHIEKALKRVKERMNATASTN